MAVAVIAAATAIGAVGERQSQPEALPLQGAAAGLGMSHQPAAPLSYTVSQMGADWRDGRSALMWFDSTPRSTAGEYTTGSGARRGLLDLASALKKRLAWRETVSTVASSNLASTPTPDLAPWERGVSIEHSGSVPAAQAETLPIPPDFDAIYHPGETIEPTPSPVHAATVRAASFGGSLTEAEVIAVLREAGAPEEWIPPLLTIAFCESRWSPGAVGDGGNSLGMFQLWHGWARPMGYTPDDLFDPVKAARTALYVREVRGRFGGGGGWTCADLRGIY